MMRAFFRLAPALLMVAVLTACKGSAPHDDDEIAKAQPPLPVQTITLIAPDGRTEKVVAEIADDEHERETGLMFRTNLPEGTGMLFVFPETQRLSFWMKNTPLPLDLLFFRDDTLIAVVPWAKPDDETPLGPPDPANRVLEVPGGWAAAKGIGAGWRLQVQP